MSPRSARLRVLAIYPHAYAKRLGHGLYRINDGEALDKAVDPGTYSTPGVAWKMAARHLGQRVAMDIKELLEQ
jgi:hypothetical protein